MNLKDAALRAAVLKALSDRIRDAYDQARADVDKALNETGAASVKAQLDGRDIATVSKAGGKPTARITDERAFLAWVTRTHPTEIETRVRESFRKQLLDAGGVDGNGEIADGVEMVDGTPYVSVRFATDGRDAVAAAWQEGRLTEITNGPTALPQGDAA